MSRFETEVLTRNENLAALAKVPEMCMYRPAEEMRHFLRALHGLDNAHGLDGWWEERAETSVPDQRDLQGSVVSFLG